MKRASVGTQTDSPKRIRLSHTWKRNLRIEIPPLSPNYCGVSPQFENYESPMPIGSPVPMDSPKTPPKCKEHEWRAAERAMNERTTYYCTKCGDIYGFP